MFTGGTIWILTHGHMARSFKMEPENWLVDMNLLNFMPTFHVSGLQGRPSCHAIGRMAKI